MAEKIRKIFVADFGAGNTCMYSINPDSTLRDPSDLIEPLGEPSGYAMKKDGTIVLGNGLYGLSSDDFESLNQFRINLKAQPTQENQEELVFYFAEWLKKVKKERKQEFEGVDESYWLIGCPTTDAWKEKETREAYKKLFERAGYENIFIIPESNAAMAYYQKNNNILDNLSQDAKLLLLDQGAYSLDATYYSNGKVESFGSCLGASLIERMMVRMILYEEEEHIRMKKTMINLPDIVDEVRKKYEQEGIGSPFHTYLLLEARQLKELYFNNLHSGKLRAGKDLVLNSVYDVEDDEFRLFVNESFMKEILENRSVKSVLGNEFDSLPAEVQDELGELTWMDAFRKYLDRLVKHYPVLDNGANVVVMLTGGGSRMNCIGEAVCVKFPEAKIHDDFNAVSAIGKGMAVWGPDKIKAIDFEEAFDAFVNRKKIDEDGDEVFVITQKLSEVFHECGQKLADELVQEEIEAVKDGIKQWLEYSCVSSEIPNKIESHFNNWSQSTGLPDYKSDIQERVDKLKKELNKEFYQVMDLFEIEHEELLKQDDSFFLSTCKTLLPNVFDSMISGIVSHYKNHEIWNNFENKKKGLFSDPRQNFINGVAESLGQWLIRETDSTVDICTNVFYRLKYGANDEEYTFKQLFLLEGFRNLQELMEKHIKEILGKLVLEEYIED